MTFSVARKAGSNISIPLNLLERFLTVNGLCSARWPQRAADRFQHLHSSLMNCRRLNHNFSNAECFVHAVHAVHVHAVQHNQCRAVSIRWNQTEHFNSLIGPKVCTINKSSIDSTGALTLQIIIHSLVDIEIGCNSLFFFDKYYMTV